MKKIHNEKINVCLVATRGELKNWLESYYLSQYPDDEPGIWSTPGRLSFHSSNYGTVTLVTTVPNPGELFIDSIEYVAENDRIVVYIKNLMNKIVDRFWLV